LSNIIPPPSGKQSTLFQIGFLVDRL